MHYAILRFEKRKGGPASALEKHHKRKKEQYASNPDIDLCFVPLTKNNRLSAKVMGNRNKLSEWQDKLHNYMDDMKQKCKNT